MTSSHSGGAASPFEHERAGIGVRAPAPGLHLPENSRFLGGSVLPRPAVFLDRDGLIIEDVHFLSDPAEVRLRGGAADALRSLGTQYYLVIVTNQSGIARDLFTEQDLVRIHVELVGRLAGAGAFVDAIYYCPHLPDAVNPVYRVACDCRKPLPGMLLRAAREWHVIDLPRSVMIGDQRRDVEAGQAAGIRSIQIDELSGDPGSNALVGLVPSILSLAAGHPTVL